MDVREVERKLASTSLYRDIAKVYDSTVWASPKDHRYHIDVTGCKQVSDLKYSDEYVIIPPAQVFKRQLQPCICAIDKR